MLEPESNALAIRAPSLVIQWTYFICWDRDSSFLLNVLRYDQHLAVGEEREVNRLRFSGVITFVENYLQNISSNIWSFSDKEQNKLTFEVCKGNITLCSVHPNVLTFLAWETKAIVLGKHSVRLVNTVIRLAIISFWSVYFCLFCDSLRSRHWSGEERKFLGGCVRKEAHKEEGNKLVPLPSYVPRTFPTCCLCYSSACYIG